MNPVFVEEALHGKLAELPDHVVACDFREGAARRVGLTEFDGLLGFGAFFGETTTLFEHGALESNSHRRPLSGSFFPFCIKSAGVLRHLEVSFDIRLHLPNVTSSVVFQREFPSAQRKSTGKHRDRPAKPLFPRLLFNRTARPARRSVPSETVFRGDRHARSNRSLKAPQ